MIKETTCIGQSEIRRTPPSVEDLERVNKVLVAIAPNVEVIDAAQKAIAREIDIFRLAYPYVDREEGLTRGRNKIAETRSKLLKLTKALDDSLSALNALSGNLEALRLYCSRTGPIGKSKKDLQILYSAAKDAADDASLHPNRSRDLAPAGLAMGIVVIMREILKVEITMTTDRVERAPGSAGYARLVRAALTAAGAKAPDDLIDIMVAGRNMADFSKQ